MNRRQFLTTLAAVPLAGLIPAPLPIPGTWGAVVRSETPFFRPHPAQERFFNAPDPVSLYGVPYHLSNATAGTWLGLTRK